MSDMPIINVNTPEEVALKLMEKIMIKEPVANTSEGEILELYKRCLKAVKFPERQGKALKAAKNTEAALNNPENPIESRANLERIHSFQVA